MAKRAQVDSVEYSPGENEKSLQFRGGIVDADGNQIGSIEGEVIESAGMILYGPPVWAETKTTSKVSEPD